MRPTKQRATQADEKANWRLQLLNAANTLIQTTPYDRLTVAQIAEQAHLAKGTVYLYFKSKEELFLGLTERLLGAWLDELDKFLAQDSLQTHDPEQRAGVIAQQLAHSLAASPILLNLLGRLHTVLETKSEYAAVLAFKRFLNERLLRSGVLLETRLFGSVTGAGGRAFVELHALAIGIEHLAHQSEVTRQVERDHPHLALGNADFAPRFAHAAAALLRGLQQEVQST
jgi:AcrR family transcriptional regulator